MISVYLHGKGRFLARQLKVSDLEFKTLSIVLNESSTSIYNTSVAIVSNTKACKRTHWFKTKNKKKQFWRYVSASVYLHVL